LFDIASLAISLRRSLRRLEGAVRRLLEGPGAVLRVDAAHSAGLLEKVLMEVLLLLGVPAKPGVDLGSSSFLSSIIAPLPKRVQFAQREAVSTLTMRTFRCAATARVSADAP
jgi:hypothetical protein